MLFWVDKEAGPAVVVPPKCLDVRRLGSRGGDGKGAARGCEEESEPESVVVEGGAWVERKGRKDP